MSTPPFPPAAVASDQPINLQRYQERSLLALLLCIGVAGPLVVFGVYLRDGLVALTWVAVGLSLTDYLLLALYATRLRPTVAPLLVYALIFTSGAAIVAHGTVRSMATLVMIAAVVGAGVFLSRRNMVIAGALGITILGVLNIAENRHLMPTPETRTGWAVWIAQTAILISLMITVNLGRRRMLDAYRSQNLALEHSREVERLLRLSQGRFQALFRGTPAACLVQSLDTLDVIDINQAFQSLFGYTHEELAGRAPPRLWAHDAEQNEFRRLIDTQGRVTGLRGLAQCKDGSAFPAMVHAEVTQSATERLLIAVVSDLSADVASRRELEISRERFSKAFNFSPLGMTITRLSDGHFVEVNPANERVLGWTKDDFTGKTSMEVGVWVSEADRNHYVGTLRRDGRLQGYETRMRAKTGAIVPVRVWAEIIEIDNEACALSFTLNVDEEKRREAMLLNVAEGVSGDTGEAFFRSLVEHLADAIGADGVMVGEVDSHRQIHTLALVWDGQLQPNGTHALQHTLCEQALLQPGPFRFESPSAASLPLIAPYSEFELHAFLGLPLRDEDGTAVGLLTAVWRQPPPQNAHLDALLTIFASRCNAELQRLRRDREIQKLHDTLEQRVAARTAQLQYLNRELDSFAYSVSHDLKSPLRSIDGFSHLLREQMLGRMTADDLDLFERIEASVQRMNSLITDLLALARVSQGTLQRMNTNLSELAQDVIRQERHRDPTRQVEVEIEDGLYADCDPRMAQIVLENLLGNAWKYTHQTAQARISLTRAEHAGPGPGPAAFCIRDNGAGFDMARAERLFKAFNRLHSSSEFEGSGIGLATVRRILERHGGHIWGEGAVGQGARFEFSFGSDTII
ncbi:PAS domain S-box protein [Hydrogenophaga pseudoflava]|uniref:PAS domain S-box protein n=1 Tax=Hydrogenophaga pseudoflava TaxID=47421 RepID=UPI0027E49A0C|nr:PAS domain S-box protein [Hydrogenophaga pseudoflava]MDQ7743982.1 PAS domain S-box protein [Hydrogenophaga pseudoflava]